MKKICCLALVCLLLVCQVQALESCAIKFDDVSDDAWYLDELEYAVYNGYVSGTGERSFSPDANITRGQFLTILGRMVGAKVESGETGFSDVDASAYYAPYVKWAYEAGYVNGYSSVAFEPDINISVEQMASILDNYIVKNRVGLTEIDGVEEFKDASLISRWAKSSMEKMRKYGIIVAGEDGNVNPQRSVSRAYGTVALVRLAKGMGIGEEPVIEVFEAKLRGSVDAHWGATL